MKAFKLNYAVMFVVALVFSSISLFAQQNNDEDAKDEEVIIIKEIIDDDGKVEVKTIKKTGDTEDVIIEIIDDGDVEIHNNFDDMDNVHIIELEELEGLSEELQEQLKDIDIEVDEIDENRHVKIILDNKAGDEEPVIIEWKGEGEIPDDVKKQMEEHGVLMNGKGFGHAPSHGFIKGNHQKNKACLGVMIGKTVENENGVETVEGESEEGVTVLDIIENSGAEAAGLLEDDIITAVNGEGVSTIHDVLDALKPYEGGETISIDFLRNNQPEQVNATLKTCANKMKIKHFESHGDNDFEFEEENEFIFENKEEGENHTKRTIVIKKRSVDVAEEQEAKSTPQNEVAGIDTVDDTVFDSTNDLELQDFSLYPNPTEGNINLAFTGEAAPTTIRIMDIAGKEVYREELKNFNGTYKKEINLSSVPKGALMLTIMQNDKIFADKVMAQ